MTKTQIFDDIISIIINDASFCKDVCAADAGAYRAFITDDMDDDAFLYTVQSYLAGFQVIGHLSFRNTERGRLPFTVKRYHDELYVVSTAKNSPLNIGDRIVAVDDIPVKEYGLRHENMLCGESEERQGFCWYTLLSYAKTVLVNRNGCLSAIPIKLDGIWETDNPYYCKQLHDNIAYIRLADFADDTAIANLYKENDTLLRNCEYLIIDVRKNEGGNDSAYAPLFEFCMAEGETVASLPKGKYDSDIEINYSERNCNHRLEQFERVLEQDIPADTRSMLTQFVTELKANRGKGFMRLGSDADDDSAPDYHGTACPRKVYVITDEECASSGDAFVRDISKCSKVTVVGRPTMGILDYSNCTGEFYDDYVLVYPTSRSLYLDQGIHMRHAGVPVDIHIPWTPKHCTRDVDLETVLDLIEKNK